MTTSDRSRPELDDTTVEALGKLSEALETLDQARGQLYGFHQHTGKADLLLQDALLDQVETSVAKIVAASKDLFPVLIVGAPLRQAGRLYNTAIVIHRGKVLGVVPKTYLPNYREF